MELDWTVVLPGGAEVPARTAEEVISFEDLVLDGVTVYPPGALDDLYAAYRGTEITFGQLYGIAQVIQTRCQGNGYLLSFAYIPPQRVKDGVYRVAVVEGFVEMFGGVNDEVRAALAGYLDSGKKLADAISRHAAKGDAAALSKVAHRLAGESVSAGAVALGRLCIELEVAASKEDWPCIRDLEPKVGFALDEVREAINAL